MYVIFGIENKLYICVFLQNQCTPLYVASAVGFNEVVKSLIAANADVNCVCKVSQLQQNKVEYLVVNY